MGILETLLGLWVFWALYVFMMGVYRAYLQNRLKGLNFVLAAPILAVAFFLDVVFQMTLASFVFLDIPRDWFVTGRLRRYLKQEAGWRKTFANYLCKHLLDPFDPTGAHCDDLPPVLREKHDTY